MRQRLGSERTAHDHIGSVDTVTRRAIRSLIRQERLQRVVNALPRLDGGFVEQRWRAVQRQDEPAMPRPSCSRAADARSFKGADDDQFANCIDAERPGNVRPGLAVGETAPSSGSGNGRSRNEDAFGCLDRRRVAVRIF
jgi:hypothetical protein